MVRKLKCILGHRVLTPVQPLLVVGVATTVAGFIFTPVACVIMIIVWSLANGVGKMSIQPVVKRHL